MSVHEQDATGARFKYRELGRNASRVSLQKCDGAPGRGAATLNVRGHSVHVIVFVDNERFSGEPNEQVCQFTRQVLQQGDVGARNRRSERFYFLSDEFPAKRAAIWALENSERSYNSVNTRVTNSALATRQVDTLVAGVVVQKAHWANVFKVSF